MKVQIKIYERSCENEKSARAVVSIVPSWWGRLRGRKTRIAIVRRSHGRWFIDASGHEVSRVLETQLNYELDWQLADDLRADTAPVLALPVARVVKK